MFLYNSDPEMFTNKFSTEFEEEFMKIIKEKYHGKRVLANKVYSDLTRDREHIHMNSTKWTTLTEFCDYLQE